MKKFLTASAALIGFGLSSLAFAVDGTIAIKGEVSSSTCGIQSDFINQAVQLAPVSQSSLAPGQNAGLKPFAIALANCAAGTKVKTHFEFGPNVDPTTGTLKNQLTGADASNVVVQLFNSDQQPIRVGNDTNLKEGTADSNGEAVMSFFAAYLAPAGETIKPGQVSTSVTYTMSYE
ncbi:hypothetical protein TUM18999_29520 [Pseudomonas tohonis]|uniref:Fimbrial-type adhesion domain-containing protein n=1 Tax=Pseudomonas tohonis TaxID=2725477 RepID=A0A6J4E8B1_9PSED|nr:fimbrial protein [Pseudomonas tohonis]BCG24761.1 hypothetical protein TUM18999_29520 [Pseudomonas tohonis]GJN54000.1 hypothetical protein TUM20286_37520 [Pseudomonas tohonis]